MPKVRPSIEEVHKILQSAGLSELAAQELLFLGDGWDFWAFRAGDRVVRLPKQPRHGEKLNVEARVSQVLAGSLPLPIPVLELHTTPEGTTFSIHQMVPGVPLGDLHRPAGPGFGAALGRFLRALHETPVEQAIALGVRVVDGVKLREYEIEDWERAVRRVFPLISCEARTYATGLFAEMLDDPILHDYELTLVHHDIDDRNLLVDPETGELTGVIDFGDVSVQDAARDYIWAYAGGFERAGIADQLSPLLRESRLRESDLSKRQKYVDVFWRFDIILHGLDIEDEDIVREGIEQLNQVVPFGIRC